MINISNQFFKDYVKTFLITLLILSSFSSFAASEECEKSIDEVAIASFNVGSTLRRYEFAKKGKTAKPEDIESLSKLRKEAAEHFSEVRAQSAETCK